MDENIRGDYFDKARGLSAAGLIAAGAAAILGALLDWASISAPAGFTGEVSESFTGIEATDGWWVIGFGAVLVLFSLMLTLQRRALYAWLAFLISIVIGAIAIADYRAIGDLSSDISRRMDIVGDADPAVGIMLVAASAVLGAIASIVGVAATPRTSD